MSFDDVWLEDYPAGTTNANELDTAISQSAKRALRQRLAIDHNLFADETGQTNIGAHKQVTIIESAADPTPGSNKGFLYTKETSGKTELFWEDEDGNILQLTSAGVILSPFKQGDWIVSTVTTARTGWTNVSATYSNKFMRINATPLTTGGSDTHDHGAATGSTTLTAAQSGLPAHSHTYNFLGSGSTPAYGSSDGQFSSFNTGTSGPTNASEGHTHSITSGDNIPAYVQVTVFQMD